MTSPFLIRFVPNVLAAHGVLLRGDTSRNRVLDQLPYTLGSAVEAIELLVVAGEDLLRSSEANDLPANSTLVHDDQARYRIGLAFDAYVATARRAQNVVLPYIGERGLPSSLSDVTKQIEAGQRDELGDLVGAYSTTGVHPGRASRTTVTSPSTSPCQLRKYGSPGPGTEDSVWSSICPQTPK